MKYVNELIERYGALSSIKADVEAAVNAVIKSYKDGGKVLLCGNGGSASDSDHVAGELLKGFLSKRVPVGEELTRLTAELGEDAVKLQRGIPAIPLPQLSGVLSAFANDVDPSLVFAQLVYALGNEKDDFRVTLVFPSHEVAVLDYISLDDGAYATRGEFDMKMLFIGDSITHGWDADYDTLSYAWRTSRHFNAETVNQGIGGAYFHEKCFDSIPFSPDVIVIAYGTNDFGHYPTNDEMRKHVSAHLTLISNEYKTAKIFVLSPN